MPARDRFDFLMKIKEQPEEDTIRVVYADWLDEFGDGDLDRATAEFIRVTCDMRSRKAASMKAGKWLGGDIRNPKFHMNGNLDILARDGEVDNWERLVPTLFEWILRVCRYAIKRNLVGWELGHPSIEWLRAGRWLKVWWYGMPDYLPEVFELEFWRGFVRRVRVRHWAMFDAILPRLLVDQPLVEPEFRGTYLRTYTERTLTWQGYYHPACFNFMGSEEMPVKYRGFRRPNPTEYGTHIWTWAGEKHRERARWATVMALRWRAERIRLGQDRLGATRMRDPFPLFEPLTDEQNPIVLATLGADSEADTSIDDFPQ